MSDPFHLYAAIPTVDLRVGAKPGSLGKPETYDSSWDLMPRLDEIGRRQLIILSMSEAGTEIPAHHLDALNLYLHSCHGLKSFKRLCKAPWHSKYAWQELRERINFPVTAALLHA